MAGASGTVRSRASSLIEPGCWLLFILLAFTYTFQFDDPLPVYDWGPAHWPRVVLFGMLLASLRLLYRDWRLSANPSAREISESAVSEDAERQRSIRVRMTLIFILPVIYTFLMHKMGFLLVTPFFLIAYMWLMGVHSIKKLLIVTVCIYSALVLVFVKLIFTYLPPGAGFFNALNGKFLGLLM